MVQLVNSIYVHGVLEVRLRQLQKPLDLCAPREAHCLNAVEQLHVHGNHVCLAMYHFAQRIRQFHVLGDADQIVNIIEHASHTTCTQDVSYHIISYHIISYHIISYHIISYHVPFFLLLLI